MGLAAFLFIQRHTRTHTSTHTHSFSSFACVSHPSHARAFHAGGTLTVESSTFAKNEAVFGDGGALYLTGTVDASFSFCTFSGNNASDSGGSVAQTGGYAKFTSCTFTNNNAYRGGGIHIVAASMDLVGCTFSDNAVSGFGGGMSVVEAFITLLGSVSTFVDNKAADAGGASCVGR